MSCRQSCRRRPFFKNFFSFSCDTDFSVCKSISCCSGLLHCSFWYFQLSQDFSCFCTTCVSKPEIWSSRVAAGREVTCRKKMGSKWQRSLGQPPRCRLGRRSVETSSCSLQGTRWMCRSVSCLLWLLHIRADLSRPPAHLFPPPSSFAVYTAHIEATGPVLFILCQTVGCACYSSFQPSAFTRQPTFGCLPPFFSVWCRPSPVSQRN